MPSIERYLWLISIAISTAVVLYVRRKLNLNSRKGTVVSLLIVNLPWLVQGTAFMVDPTVTVHNIFSARLGWAAYGMVASVAVVWCAAYYWLFTLHGAEHLAASPIPVLNLPGTARGIKLFFVAAVSGGIIGFIVLIARNL